MNVRLPIGFQGRPCAAVRPSRVLVYLLTGILLCIGGGAIAQKGGIQSVEEADRILEDVAKQRAALEERYAGEEYRCMDKFFANACADEVRERRRVEMNAVRDREVEASAYKRQAKVVEREAALAEKQTKEAEALPQRTQKQKETEAKKAESGQKKVANGERQAQRQQAAPQTPTRAAEHEARMRAREANAAADAQKRAENIAAYEAKVQQAEEHRKAVEERKAEKARKRAEKNAAAAPAGKPDQNTPGNAAPR